MKNQKLIALLAGAALTAAAGTAFAADTTLNLFGSSAQAKFWGTSTVAGAQVKTQVENWMLATVANGGLGCASTSSIASIAGSGNDSGNTYYQMTGTGCTSTLVTNLNADGSLTVNYGSDDSVSGIMAAQGQVDTFSNDACSQGPTYRLLPPQGGGTLTCQPITVGVSDVAASAIVEVTYGAKTGPMGGATVVPNYSGAAYNAPDGNTYANTVIQTSNVLDLNQPNTLATPFAFWVNNAVTATQCTSGLVGDYCASNADCDTAYAKGNGVCGAASTIKNMTRSMAVMLFSGQVPNWSYFGNAFTAQPVTICLRHAGSGTMATLDNAVISAGQTGWGAGLVTAQETYAAGSNPNVWFNWTSTNEMNCIAGETTANSGALSAIGAVGYSDADASNATNVSEMTYQGVYPTRSAMSNGIYDFYAIAHYYVNSQYETAANGGTATAGTANAYLGALANSMVSWAAVPTNMAPAKSNYWATVNEMNYYKTSDFAYPAFEGANIPFQN
jgi:hypothetical protein